MEELINITNAYYKEHNIALIYKRPTPIKVAAINKETKEITKAYFEKHSTTDYYGVYKGRYIDFEAKSTNLTRSFPIKNIHTYQISHLIDVHQMGGISFLIIAFNSLNRIFLLFIEDYLNFRKRNKRASIPLSYFEKVGHELSIDIKIPLNYIIHVENYANP